MTSAGFAVRGVRVLRGGRAVLDIPELELPRGRVTAVVGPSGAGKSTLLRLLAGLETPNQGTAASHGPNDEALAPGCVVMVFQRPVLFRGAVEENVAIGLRLRGERDTAARVREVLAAVGLPDKARQQVRTLSGGEYQRVALARGLVLRPAALLLDEPTANLDPENVGIIERLVAEHQRATGMSVLWVTHNPAQAARVADGALLLVGGEVVEYAATEVFYSERASTRTQDFLAGRMVW